jgi:hypothetical protein
MTMVETNINELFRRVLVAAGVSDSDVVKTTTDDKGVTKFIITGGDLEVDMVRICAEACNIFHKDRLLLETKDGNIKPFFGTTTLAQKNVFGDVRDPLQTIISKKPTYELYLIYLWYLAHLQIKDGRVQRRKDLPWEIELGEQDLGPFAGCVERLAHKLYEKVFNVFPEETIVNFPIRHVTSVSADGPVEIRTLDKYARTIGDRVRDMLPSARISCPRISCSRIGKKTCCCAIGTAVAVTVLAAGSGYLQYSQLDVPILTGRVDDGLGGRLSANGTDGAPVPGNVSTPTLEPTIGAKVDEESDPLSFDDFGAFRTCLSEESNDEGQQKLVIDAFLLQEKFGTMIKNETTRVFAIISSNVSFSVESLKPATDFTTSLNTIVHSLVGDGNVTNKNPVDSGLTNDSWSLLTSTCKRFFEAVQETVSSVTQFPKFPHGKFVDPAVKNQTDAFIAAFNGSPLLQSTETVWNGHRPAPLTIKTFGMEEDESGAFKYTLTEEQRDVEATVKKYQVISTDGKTLGDLEELKKELDAAITKVSEEYKNLFKDGIDTMVSNSSTLGTTINTLTTERKAKKDADRKRAEAAKKIRNLNETVYNSSSFEQLATVSESIAEGGFKTQLSESVMTRIPVIMNTTLPNILEQIRNGESPKNLPNLFNSDVPGYQLGNLTNVLGRFLKGKGEAVTVRVATEWKGPLGYFWNSSAQVALANTLLQNNFERDAGLASTGKIESDERTEAVRALVRTASDTRVFEPFIDKGSLPQVGDAADGKTLSASELWEFVHANGPRESLLDAVFKDEELHTIRTYRAFLETFFETADNASVPISVSNPIKDNTTSIVTSRIQKIFTSNTRTLLPYNDSLRFKSTTDMLEVTEVMWALSLRRGAPFSVRSALTDLLRDEDKYNTGWIRDRLPASLDPSVLLTSSAKSTGDPSDFVKAVRTTVNTALRGMVESSTRERFVRFNLFGKQIRIPSMLCARTIPSAGLAVHPIFTGKATFNGFMYLLLDEIHATFGSARGNFRVLSKRSDFENVFIKTRLWSAVQRAVSRLRDIATGFLSHSSLNPLKQDDFDDAILLLRSWRRKTTEDLRTSIDLFMGGVQLQHNLEPAFLNTIFGIAWTPLPENIRTSSEFTLKDGEPDWLVMGNETPFSFEGFQEEMIRSLLVGDGAK